jgi:hypothetical protein
MSWNPPLTKFSKEYNRRIMAIFHRTVQLVYESVVLGSPVTGAPGQPVDTGALRASWAIRWLSPTQAQISTGIDYAIHVELNERNVTFRVGGAHSLSKTRANFDKLYEQATREVLAGAA